MVSGRSRRHLWPVPVVVAIVVGAFAWMAITGSSSPAHSPGMITAPFTRDGHGTLALTAKWRSRAEGHDRLAAVSARFSTCYRSGFLHLATSCPGLTLPYFRFIITAPTGRIIYEVSTRRLERYHVYARRTSWVTLVNPRTGEPYDMASPSNLIVQLWAFDYRKGALSEVAQVRD